MFDLNPVPKIISFDCYGTLVQWREVLVRELGGVLHEEGRDEDEAGAVLDTFSKFSHELTTAKPHRIYKDVLRIGTRKALEAHNISATDERIERIAQSIRTMGPHSEVPGVLRKLRSRYKLAIFTNSDDDLIVHNVEKIGVAIDYVITAEQAKAYKPSRAIFEYAHRVIGVHKDETVHVAMSMVLDMQACHKVGIRGIWINRLGEIGNPDWLPYKELPDLRGVPDLLHC